MRLTWLVLFFFQKRAKVANSILATNRFLIFFEFIFLLVVFNLSAFIKFSGLICFYGGLFAHLVSNHHTFFTFPDNCLAFALFRIQGAGELN